MHLGNVSLKEIQMKKFAIWKLYGVLCLLTASLGLSGCGSTPAVKTDSEPQVVQASAEPAVAFSFEDEAVALPSPASVQLGRKGRLGERFGGNINYLRYQHDHYGEFMIESFASRHYSPGKLLERVWDGEYAGKWLDAATRTAVNTGDDAQLAMVDAFAASLRQRQQPDGYMGIKLPTDRTLNGWEQAWDVWVQWNCMIGFLTHYELRQERASLEAASGVGDWIVKTYSPIEDGRFLRSGIGFTNIVVIGQLVRLYRHTANEDMLEFVEQVWDGLVRDHLFPTGSLGDREDLSEGPLKDTPGGQLQETCATTEWIFFTQSLYAITGRAKYAEALEKTCYNALLAAQSADGMKWCYWTPLRYSKHFLYGPTRCCFWSGPKGIARLPQLIYATKGNTVYVNFFETSNATLATNGGKVHVTQASEFPKTGRSTVTLKTPPGWKGMLRIRVPSWSTDFQAKLNGRLVPNSSDVKGYCDVNLQDSSEYQIEVQFDIPLLLEQLSGDNYAMRRGPEVLSIDARDNIDTWLGPHDDLITIPEEIALLPIDSGRRYQWAGPTEAKGSRRRYLVNLNDARTSEPRGLILTPYADAGNEGAAFRTVFPLAKEED